MVSCALSGVQMRPRTNSGHSLSRFSVPLLPKPHLLEARSERGHFYDLLYDLLEELTDDTCAFDSSDSSWGEPTAGEVSDLERIVVYMQRYRVALPTAVANIPAPICR